MDSRTETLLHRTRLELDSGIPLEDILRGLRDARYGFSESVGALVKAAGMTPQKARAAAAQSPVWAHIPAPKPAPPNTGQLRVERIDPPDPPDTLTLQHMHRVFVAQPRVVEAYLVGEHLIPDDDSPSFDTTRVVILLERQPDALASERTRCDVDALTAELSSLAWSDPPRREWGFVCSSHAPKRPRVSHWMRNGELLYSRQQTSA